MENNKTQAEIYREERKERLAKAAAKNAKKSPQSMKAKRMVKKVISIVLAVVIAVGAVCGVLNFFDIPQKTVKVSVDGLDARISLGEINYYYYQAWYQFFSTAMQYESYGEGMSLTMTGFDYSKTPDQQEFTEQAAQIAGITLEDLGKDNPTWEDAFTYSAISSAVYAKYGAMKAEEAGIKLTDEEIKAIEDEVESVRTNAKKEDYSLNRFLRTQIGSGVTEKVIYEASVNASLAQKYFEKYTNDTRDAITADQINAQYEYAKDNYDVADIRVYKFTTTMDEKDHKDMSEEEHDKAHKEAEKETKKLADAFLKEVKDEESFIAEAKKAILAADSKSTKDPDKETLVKKASKSSLTTSYCEDLAKWVYDDARKVGDTTVVSDGEGSYFVVYMKTLADKDKSASSSDVRHILIKFPDKNTDGTPTSTTDSSGKKTTNITKETKAETKAEAEKILEEYKKNPTEENFIELTKKHTDDVDSKGNPNSDGIYKDVSDNGQYVEAFTNWAIDSTRKPGDTGIVETEYGYHIMYYVEANEESWYLAIQNELLNKKLEDTLAKEIDEMVKSVNMDSIFIDFALNKENDLIAKHILSYVR